MCQKHNVQENAVVPQQVLHQNYLQPSFSAYKGRSLPNVNHIASNSIDLQVRDRLILITCLTLVQDYFAVLWQ